jgi:hypothetical protein
MEFVEGTCLNDVWRAMLRVDVGDRASRETLVRLAYILRCTFTHGKQALRMMECVKSFHDRDVVHGDVHERNIILPPNQPWNCIFIDFGLCFNPKFPGGNLPQYARTYQADGGRLTAKLGVILGFPTLCELIMKKAREVGDDEGWIRFLSSMRGIDSDGTHWSPMGEKDMKKSARREATVCRDYQLDEEEQAFLDRFVYVADA